MYCTFCSLLGSGILVTTFFSRSWLYVSSPVSPPIGLFPMHLLHKLINKWIKFPEDKLVVKLRRPGGHRFITLTMWSQHPWFECGWEPLFLHSFPVSPSLVSSEKTQMSQRIFALCVFSGRPHSPPPGRTEVSGWSGPLPPQTPLSPGPAGSPWQHAAAHRL